MGVRPTLPLHGIASVAARPRSWCEHSAVAQFGGSSSDRRWRAHLYEVDVPARQQKAHSLQDTQRETDGRDGHQAHRHRSLKCPGLAG